MKKKPHQSKKKSEKLSLSDVSFKTLYARAAIPLPSFCF